MLVDARGRLLDRVQALENQTLLEGFIAAPVYDSGWVNITMGKP